MDGRHSIFWCPSSIFWFPFLLYQSLSPFFSLVNSILSLPLPRLTVFGWVRWPMLKFLVARRLIVRSRWRAGRTVWWSVYMLGKLSSFLTFPPSPIFFLSSFVPVANVCSGKSRRWVLPCHTRLVPTFRNDANWKHGSEDTFSPSLVGITNNDTDRGSRIIRNSNTTLCTKYFNFSLFTQYYQGDKMKEDGWHM
jgi:hypothetical protein